MTSQQKRVSQFINSELGIDPHKEIEDVEVFKSQYSYQAIRSLRLKV